MISLPVVGLDDPGGLVPASGRQMPAVGAEGDGARLFWPAPPSNIALVRDPEELLAGRGLDDPGGAVTTTGRQIPAVGAEGEGGNIVLVRDPEELLAGH